MAAGEWKCRVIRTNDGGLVLDLPGDLAEKLGVTSGDDIIVEKARNGFFEMWKEEQSFNPAEIIDRMNRICQEALDEPSK